MLNKYTILFGIKEARDRRLALINKRTVQHIFKQAVEWAFFVKTPLLARLKENVK